VAARIEVKLAELDDRDAARGVRAVWSAEGRGQRE